MNSTSLPPNPCLVAILLVVNHHHQPHLVFHYPPRPGEDNSLFNNYLKSDLSDGETTSSDDDSPSSSDGYSSPKDDGLTNNMSKNVQEVDLEEAGSASPEKINGLASMRRQPRWDDVLGYGTINLAKLLCPAPSAHKRRFEMCLNDKVFLGWPVFSKDGQWQKRKKEKRLRSQGGGPGEKALHGGGGQGNTIGKASLRDEAGDMPGQETDGGQYTAEGIKAGTPREQYAANDLPDGARGEACKPKTTTNEYRSEDTLKMFHVVFALDPPPLEYHLRVKEMYDNVVKKFSRALKWEQAHSGYVSKEASTISGASKGYHKPLGSDHPLAPMYQQILSQSRLAKAISTLFNCISSSKIAHIRLTPTLSLSLQIPIPTSTSILPNLLSPQLPGLWLTTANPLPTDDDIDSNAPQLASHFTLLLLSDLSSILLDVNDSASPITGPLAHYLRVQKPTKSFVQISQSSGIPLLDIQFLASHLIYWRRARAIPPLHQRDTYIVSPNADMQKLASATSAFAKAFPNLPSLPKFLNLLSFTPRPYSALIPSQNHKEVYLEILAWLLRNGWVTQLRTFVWIRVPPHIRETVASQPDLWRQPDESNDSFKEVPGAQAAVSTRVFSSSPTFSTHSSSADLSIPPHFNTPSLVPDPQHASAIPSGHLAAISAHVLERQGKEIQAAWDKCVKYFDGRHAVEIIAVRESWKRKRVGELVAGWEALGLLVRGRHW